MNHYVAATGGRKYTDIGAVTEVIRFLRGFYGAALRLIHGDAQGADKLADVVARQYGVRVKPFPADWDTYHKAAGPIRNAQMVKFLMEKRTEGHAVQVSSHTDELPSTAGVATTGTSWELSSGRATAIVRSLLEAPVRMAPERLSATGHASFRPEVPMDSPQNRLRNRRVELELLPMPVPPASLLATLEPTPPPIASAKEEPAQAKSGKRSGRR